MIRELRRPQIEAGERAEVGLLSCARVERESVAAADDQAIVAAPGTQGRAS